VQQQFRTTRWSIVLTAADPASLGSAEALESLCSAYWYPLYAFVRRQGWKPHEAEDLTQTFFAKILEKDYLAGVGPQKGRFRTFLLVCMKHFLANERVRSQAIKRGGGKKLFSIDLRDAEGRYIQEPSHTDSPERIYERRWALTVLERALQRLAEDLKAGGKERMFEGLKGYLVVDADPAKYAETAAALGMNETAVRVAVHRLRDRYRRKVIEEITATVGHDSEVDEEIERLFQILAE
jgi:RNA polymerase sigma factor (sigma-70 family)